jgi:hypothetical protein
MTFVLNKEGRVSLGKRFTLEVTKLAIFQMKKNKAPCPDGLPIEFSQHLWH